MKHYYHLKFTQHSSLYNTGVKSIRDPSELMKYVQYNHVLRYLSWYFRKQFPLPDPQFVLNLSTQHFAKDN